MRRNDTTRIGDAGEAEALRLLTKRGYTGWNLNDRQRNTWTYDLEVNSARGKVLISVKTARAKRDVSLGRPRSLERLADDAFLMILMPVAKGKEIRLSPGGYHLLIVPGRVARDEALSMHYDYWGEEVAKAAENTVRVKDEVNRPGSRSRAGDVFASWNQRFRDAWHILPEPSPQTRSVHESTRKPLFSADAAPQAWEGREVESLSDARILPPKTKGNFGAEFAGAKMTPQEIVRSLEYLRHAGMSEEQVCAMHHFAKRQSYSYLIEYFSEKSFLGSDTNRLFGERLTYVVKQHSLEKRTDFAQLISEALQWRPLRR